jgi:hypothetical protein
MRMADIEIIYSEGYCECMGGDYCMQCHTQVAEDLGCKMFNEGKHEKNVIPFGDCIHANFKYIYKGMSIKNYELEALDDPYNPHLNCMMLKTRNDWYQCEKVVLNGKVIYGEDFDAQTESEG